MKVDRRNAGQGEMMLRNRWWWKAVAACGLCSVSTVWGAATPSASDALKLEPVQKRVKYTVPDAGETKNCTIKNERINGTSGWVVRDETGQVLRMFIDTNSDNVVDLWCYFDEGIEVYRDIDADFNGKADQYRWLNTGGTRWGLDQDEDGRIDRWKQISAEELSAEVVAAVAAKDAATFEAVLLAPAEIEDLGLGEQRAKELLEKIKTAATDFKKALPKQKGISTKSTWTHFTALRPGVVPAGADGATKDITVYENVLAVVDTEGKQSQLHLGTLVRVGDAWRVIGAPEAVDAAQVELTLTGFFFKAQAARRPDASDTAGNSDESVQKLFNELETLDKSGASVSGTKALGEYHRKRADLIEQISGSIAEPAERAQWYRQLADTLSAAVQSGVYPEGVARLKEWSEKLSQESKDQDLLAYFKFRAMSAEYTQSLQAPDGGDFVKIQSQWLESLEEFVDAYPNSQDTSDAMLQLAIAQEFAGQEPDSLKWYTRIVEKFPNSAPAKKAAGARRRLESVGQTLEFEGATLSGQKLDLRSLKGKAVLIHFWATTCEPCINDLKVLKDLHTKYGKTGLTLVGVCLDADKKTAADFVAKNRLAWPQVFEPGALDSRPALELGVLTLPTMILVGPDGKVINRNIHASEIEPELKKRVKQK